MQDFFKDLSSQERTVFKKLNTPVKIQNFLESIPVNFENNGDTLYSPRMVLEKKTAHCLEGALFAIAILRFHKKSTLLLDMQPGKFKDDGHAVALYKEGRYWGAISKTNHAVLKFRDPVYKSPREIVMSYFHEYFLDNGKKTLRTYTVTDLKKIKNNWITDRRHLWYIDQMLDDTIYIPIAPTKNMKLLRKADPIEIKAGKITRWKNKNPSWQ